VLALVGDTLYVAAWAVIEIELEGEDGERSLARFAGRLLASEDESRPFERDVYLTARGQLLVYYYTEHFYTTHELTEENLARVLRGEPLQKARRALGWMPVDDLDV